MPVKQFSMGVHQRILSIEWGTLIPGPRGGETKLLHCCYAPTSLRQGYQTSSLNLTEGFLETALHHRRIAAFSGQVFCRRASCLCVFLRACCYFSEFAVLSATVFRRAIIELTVFVCIAQFLNTCFALF